jgi:hypothetical protein
VATSVRQGRCLQTIHAHAGARSPTDSLARATKPEKSAQLFAERAQLSGKKVVADEILTGEAWWLGGFFLGGSRASLLPFAQRRIAERGNSEVTARLGCGYVKASAILRPAARPSRIA